MKRVYLEHANITVEDIEASVRFVRTAFPGFEVRGSGESRTEDGPKKWAHVGDERTYLAFEESLGEIDPKRVPYRDSGINHVGFVVEDLEDVTARLRNGGHEEGIIAEIHPFRARRYFYDPNGVEYEFVQYFSDDPGERNKY